MQPNDLQTAVLPDPLVMPLGDTPRLIALLSEVLERSPEWAYRTLLREERCLGITTEQDGRAWGIRPHVWGDGMIRLYEESDGWLPGHAVWNRRREKLQMRAWIGSFLATFYPQRADVLTVGDGAGYDSLYLAQCGHRVTYSEQAFKSRRFAARVFADAGQTFVEAEAWSSIPAEAFDAIVCLDVIEHVPDPPGFVGELVRMLRPGGRLIVHAPFFFLHPAVLTHLRSNRRYSGALFSLYGRNGLRMETGRTWWDPLVLRKAGGGIGRAAGSSRRRLSLRASGLLLAAARVWSWPHCQAAIRIMRHGDPQWTRDLERLAPQYGVDPAVPGDGPN